MKIAPAALLALAALAACRTRITPEEEKSRLEELIPAGTPAPRVESVLDSLHIDHSHYDSAEHQIRAIDRHTAHAPLIDTSIRIELRFDSQGRLLSRKVEEVRTGP
ncbi:MAG TPA: hypothetical protein VFJ16_25480 [Longimicrobium sp.]|nr:hypothetical protein [Longimicrobium sp.]